jgi:hypothetical protein
MRALICTPGTTLVMGVLFAGSGAIRERSVCGVKARKTCPPSRAITVPIARTVDSLGSKPFLRMISRTCSTVILLPRLSVRVAAPSFRLTTTFSIPSSFFKATLTAWEQVAQSIP